MTNIPLTTDGGVTKVILREGTGEIPLTGSQVAVHYEGRLVSGTVFDSSYSGYPYSFELGKLDVIKGWEICVASMRVGESCRVTCSSDYAYGDQGHSPDIPPSATLIFDLELLSHELKGQKKSTAKRNEEMERLAEVRKAREAAAVKREADKAEKAATKTNPTPQATPIPRQSPTKGGKKK